MYIYYFTQNIHSKIIYLITLELKRKLWENLNNICPQSILEKGRFYGGGLYKIEPKELGSVPAEELVELFPDVDWKWIEKQASLFE